MANIAAGELGVWLDGEEFIFRPSFRALSRMGEPKELGGLLNRVQQGNRSAFAAALAVLSACCDKDISKLAGYYKDLKGRLRYVQGVLPWEDVYYLGAKLLANGMAGDLSHSRRLKPMKEDDAKKAGQEEFDPAKFAAAAMVHLGLDTESAWNLTMHDFQRAMAVKFPDSVCEVPSKEDYKATVDAVMSIRRRAKKHE